MIINTGAREQMYMVLPNICLPNFASGVSLGSLIEVHVSVTDGGFGDMRNLLVVEESPFAVLLDVAEVVSGHGGGAHVTNKCEKFVSSRSVDHGRLCG